MTVVLVCGGRDYSNRKLVFDTLDSGHEEMEGGITRIVHGGSSGVDALAGQWAEENCIECIVFKASWYLQGKPAGPMRNQRMLEEASPDIVLAFPGGAGTADMVRRAVSQGFYVMKVTEE